MEASVEKATFKVRVWYTLDLFLLYFTDWGKGRGRRMQEVGEEKTKRRKGEKRVTQRCKCKSGTRSDVQREWIEPLPDHLVSPRLIKLRVQWDAGLSNGSIPTLKVFGNQQDSQVRRAARHVKGQGRTSS